MRYSVSKYNDIDDIKNIKMEFSSTQKYNSKNVIVRYLFLLALLSSMRFSPFF